MTAAPSLAKIVQANIIRLRTERGLTQRELSILLTVQGIRALKPNAITQIETGRKPADRLIDIAAFCAVFSVSVNELISTDGLVATESDSPPVSSNVIAFALDGKLVPPAVADLADLDTPDRYDAERQAASALGLTHFEFWSLVREVFWPNARTFTEVRDLRAGLTDDMPASSIRARRGHATRQVVMELKEVLDRDGIQVIVDRLTARTQEVYDNPPITQNTKVNALDDQGDVMFNVLDVTEPFGPDDLDPEG